VNIDHPYKENTNDSVCLVQLNADSVIEWQSSSLHR
jgi:hypothetical protein